MPKAKRLKLTRKKHADRAVPGKLPKPLVKARQHKVLGLYAGGRTPHQIAALLDMRLTDVSRDLRIAVDELVREYAKPTPEQTFVRYAAFQFGIIGELKIAVQKFKRDKESKQYGAMISALRTQSDIYDKIMDKGTEFGVIQKKKASDIIRKQPEDIRTELRVEITKLTRLLDEIDDSTQAASIRATQTTITYSVRIRKPLRTEFGIARALPDWKYRTKLYDSEGNVIPKAQLTSAQREMVAASDIDNRLQSELVSEFNKLVAQEQHGPTEQRISNNNQQDKHKQITTQEDDIPTVITRGKKQDSWLVTPKKA